MNLLMPGEVGNEYRSLSQRARVVSEAWGADNLYCTNCDSEKLAPLPANTRAVDFRCPQCASQFQLKCQSKPLGGQVADAGYKAMCDSIRRDGPSNLLALHYDPAEWLVRNLIVVPRFVFSMSSIRKRNPLRSQAQRHGHILCTILLCNFPVDAKIPIVNDGVLVSPKLVREQYSRLRPLAKAKHDARGWTLDVLNVVRRLPKFRGSGFGTRDSAKGRAALTMSQAVGAGLETRPYEFTLDEVYAFADELARLHPQNKNVEPKIRQQLQILRDMGLVEFIGRGRYRASGIGAGDSGLGRGNP